MQVHGLEASDRLIRILKPLQAYRAYRDAIHLGCMRSLVRFIDGLRLGSSWRIEQLPKPIESGWTNVGGQLIHRDDISCLINDVKSGSLDTWASIHARYLELGTATEIRQAGHAIAVLCDLYRIGRNELTRPVLETWAERAVAIQREAAQSVRAGRQKDYDDEFRSLTYAGQDERNAVLGELADNPVIEAAAGDAERFEGLVAAVFG
jgi:hypothetical protein